jgi:hypothetical protein
VGFKRPVSQVDRVPPSNAEVKSVWSCTSTVHDVLMEWYIFITTVEFAVTSRRFEGTESHRRHLEIVSTPEAQFLVCVLRNKFRQMNRSCLYEIRR